MLLLNFIAKINDSDPLIFDSWQTLRAKMENQQQITVVFKREDGKSIHLRWTTWAEPYQKEIYDILVSCLSLLETRL